MVRIIFEMTRSKLQPAMSSVLDLATRFTKGELTTEKLLKANDDELYDMLTAVRGIGKVCTHLCRYEL